MVEDTLNDNIRFCECGCGQKITYNKYRNTRFISGHNSRVNHPNFKTGKHKNGKYTETLVKPYTYKLEHRRIYEEFYKCCLLSYTDIHHITPLDEGGTDNIENLQPLYRPQHMSLHFKIDMSDRVCSICGSNKTYTRKNGSQQWNTYKNKIVCNKCYELTPERKQSKKRS